MDLKSHSTTYNKEVRNHKKSPTNRPWMHPGYPILRQSHDRTGLRGCLAICDLGHLAGGVKGPTRGQVSGQLCRWLSENLHLKNAIKDFTNVYT